MINFFYFRTSKVIFTDMNMQADFKWIWAKNFEDSFLWPKIQMTDTLSILAPKVSSPSVCDWHNHFIWKSGSEKQCRELLIVYLCLMRSIRKKITYCIKNFLVREIKTDLVHFSLFSFRYHVELSFFFFKSTKKIKIMSYKWLRRFQHSFLTGGFF